MGLTISIATVTALASSPASSSRAAGKLYLINRFFYPDFSATSQMLTDLAVGLAGEYHITVVTSRTLYNDSLATRVRKDEYQGVEDLH